MRRATLSNATTYTRWRSYFSVIHRFARYLRPNAPSLGVATSCGLAYALARLVNPWPLKLIFDNVLFDKRLDGVSQLLIGSLAGSKLTLLGVLIGVLIILALLGGFFYYYKDVYTTRVGQEVTSSIRRDLYLHLQRLSLSFHSKHPSGELVMRLTGDIMMLREVLVAVLLSLTSDGMVLLGMTVIMFLMDWQLAALAVVVIPVLFLLVRGYRRQIKEAVHKQRKREGQLASIMQETIAAIKVVQGFAREKYEMNRFEDQNTRSLKAGLRTSRFEALMNWRIELALAAATAAVLGLGVHKVLLHVLTPGDLLVFMAYVNNFYSPIRRFSKATERGAKATVCAERVLEILETRPDVRDRADAVPAPHFVGEIVFENVTFEYEKGQPVLKDMNLHIRPGEKVAIVGATGAGKSKLASLIPRFYDPSGGRILIDGHDIREFKLASLRKQIALVLQEPILFATTIRENIAYTKPSAPMEKIIKAAKRANIHDFIASLPEGYETTIGERGTTLSGGQRQRIAIARALMRRSPIIILDEPTIGLDAQSEALILETLHRLMEDRTVLTITHSIRNARNADRIIVLEDSRIIEEGTHIQLIQRGGLYNHLYHLQVDGDEIARAQSVTEAERVS